MKDKRNCSGMYPVYPTPVQNQMPVMPYQMPYYMPGQTVMNNTIDINSLQSQVNNLDNRVSKLEQMITSINNGPNTINNNKYNDSNYYMV